MGTRADFYVAKPEGLEWLDTPPVPFVLPERPVTEQNEPLAGK